MNGDLDSSFLWSFLTILAVLLTVSFGCLFHKDRDKRKLMFMLAFAFASLTYLPKMETGLESIQVMERLYYWSSLPIMSAVLIAVISALLKLEDFDKPFKVFLFTLAASIFMIVAPLPVESVRSLLFRGISMIVIVVSVYLILIRRGISHVMFLFSMICFISAGLGMARGLGIEFSVFAYIFAYVFIVLVFVTSKEGVEGGIASFFTLKRELEKTQEELRESEEKYRKQFEEALDAIFVADAETGIIIDCNRAASELVGREKSELIGKHQRILHPPGEIEGQFSRTFKQHLNEKEGQVLETQLVTKRGEIKDVAIKANIFELKGKKIIQGIFRDITERKRMQKKLKEYSQHLEELVEKRTKQLKKTQEGLLKAERLAAIGEVAAMVGHDLRNPLQSIENATYYLNNELSRLPSSKPISPKTMKMLQILNDSVHYADNVIKDLQDFSTPKKPTLKKTSINTILKEALSQVEIPENVKLITELSHIPEIKIDEDMMKRVFLNLTTNGIQAMKTGGTLKVSTKKTKDFIEISFKDTGIGMSKEKIEKIFTPFFTTKAKGIGMGLPICKKFVEAHGGSIEVESQEGKGTTFTVKLPIQQEKRR